ncbi:MAG: hypothetical protein ACE5DM_03845 [Candidatus Nanoarchaeia archaeon]
MQQRRMLGRRAQAPTGAQAATLIVLITLLIIFYLLFIPPDIRDQILEGAGENISGAGLTKNRTLLLETPGTLESIAERDIEHIVPAVFLFATEDAKVLESIPALFVKRSVFTKKDANVTFEIDDPQNVENVLLTFLAEERKGTLIVRVNGGEIYSGKVETMNVDPMKISKKNLVAGTNTITFSAPDIGWAFWRSNMYQLRSIQITGDVTDISQQLSKNIFIVSTTERNNVDRAVIRFTPDCIPGQVGVLNAFVNGHSIYSAVPDCGSPVAVEFNPNSLRTGENTLVFQTDEGNYLVDLVKITSEMKKSFQPAFYFELSEREYDAAKDDEIDYLLKLTFAEGREMKQGTININGQETAVYQPDRIYEKKINDFLVKDSNSIKIIPDGRLEIVKLEVVKE